MPYKRLLYLQNIGLGIVLLMVGFIAGCAEDNPFLPKISQRALPATTSGYLELRYIGNRTTVVATLSKSDMKRLIPKDPYGGDLDGDFGDGSTAGTGTYMNANFDFAESTADASGSQNDGDGVCEDASGVDGKKEQCVLRPWTDSIYLLNFDMTKKGGLLEQSLDYISANFGSKICTAEAGCSSEEKMGAMLNMTPNTIPIQNIPILGFIYTLLVGIADLFGLGGAIDSLIRAGVAAIYGIGTNDLIVSKEMVNEATIRSVMYDVTSNNPDDISNRKKTLVLCEENSSPNNGSKICNNPGGLRKGTLGNQEMPLDPPTQLGDPGPGRRNASAYVGTRLALPVFMGDSMGDMEPLFTGTYKAYLDFKRGDNSNPQPRYSYMATCVIGTKIYSPKSGNNGCDTDTELKTVIMYDEAGPTPDPDSNEFFQRLPVTINGTAFDGFDLSKGSYAGADSLTADAILLWVSDRGAYFGGCLPNSNGVYYGGTSANSFNDGCDDWICDPNDKGNCYVNPATGDETQFYGAGMYMDNMNPAPKLNMTMFMRADQVRANINTAIEYQYKDKTTCIGWSIFNYCDFGFELDMQSFTGDMIDYFYDTQADLYFQLKDIDLGLTREELIAASKQSFTGYINGDQSTPIVDPGDFQSVNPKYDPSVTIGGSFGTDPWYCDPLQPGYPGTCNSFRGNTLGDQLTPLERLWKAKAQQPLRVISDTLFDNSVGSPNFYLNQLKLRLTKDCTAQPADTYKRVPVLFYQDQGGVGVKAGFYLDQNLTQDICTQAGNCIEAEMVPGANPPNCLDAIDLTSDYSTYLNSNKYLILNNKDKTIYMQAETGDVFKLEWNKSSDPYVVRAKWHICDATSGCS